MPAHAFEIPIHDLDAGGRSFEFTVPVAWIQGALEDHEASAAASDGSLEVRASKSGTNVVIQGQLRANLTIPCARCLNPTHHVVNQAFSTMMVPKAAIKGSKGPRDEYEFAGDEADVAPYTGDTIVLDDLVRDELILEIPMIPLCSADCKGMSSSLLETEDIFDDGGVDPRLRPLLDFQLTRFKKTDKE